MILDAILGGGARRSTTPLTTSAAGQAAWLYDALGGSPSDAGVHVNEATALALPTVYACIRVLAESVAQLPLVLYRQVGRKREPARDHPLYRLAAIQPNPEHTSFVLRELLMAHLAGFGNAYLLVNRRRGGAVAELWPVHPMAVRVERAGGRKFFQVTEPAGGMQRLTDDDILHIPGLSYDGVAGWSPIRVHREAIGWGLATQQFSAKFFGNGAQVGGVLTHPGTVVEPEKIRRQWMERYSQEGRLGIAVLSNGMKYEQIGINPDDAQFVQTRALQIADICRIFNVPPSMVQDYGRATWNNAEQAALAFVKHSLMPWLVRIEAALNTGLLSEREQESLFFKFKVQGLLRGDNAGRASFYQSGVMNGWMTRNEVRELEDLDPLEGLDEALVPASNAQPAAPTPQKDPPSSPSGGGGEEEGEDDQERAIAWAQAARVLQKEVGELRRLRQSTPNHDAWRAAVNDFYREHQKYLVQALAVTEEGARAFLDARWRALEAPETVKSTLDAWAAAGPAALLEALRHVRA